MIEITEVFTNTTGGTRSQTLPGGQEITFVVRFEAPDIPPSTLLRVFFIAEAVEQIHSDPYVFKPWYIHHFDQVHDPGARWASSTWTLPGSNPFPTSPLPLADLERHFSESWRFRNWGMAWTLKSLVFPLSPAVSRDSFGFTRDPWVYYISY